MSRENERRARELFAFVVDVVREGGDDDLAIGDIKKALDEAEARGRADRWKRIDHDEPATLPAPGTVVLLVDMRKEDPYVCRGFWDAEHDDWRDAETDGCDDQLQWSKWHFTHWAPWPEPPTPTTEPFDDGPDLMNEGDR